MNYVIIDNNKEFAAALSRQLKNGSEHKIPESDLAKFTETLKKDTINDNDVILININIKPDTNAKRQDLKGIELLIWLRIKGVMNHAVLYSFETLHSFLNRNPKHLIATSKGTSFIQLPNDFNSLKLEILSMKKAEKKGVIEYLKPVFNIEDFKHSEANWWGVKVLWGVYNIVNTSSDKYPDFIIDKFSVLKNAVTKEIYEFGIEKIEYVISEETQRINDNLVKTEATINKLDCILSNTSLECKDIEEIIKNLQDTLYELEDTARVYCDASISLQIQEKRNELNIWLQEYDSKQKEFVSNQEQQQTQSLKLTEVTKQLNNISQIIIDKFSSITSVNLETKRQIRNNNNDLEILYIDDNAEKGWVDVLKKITGLNNIKTIVPGEQFRNDIDALYEDQIKVSINDVTSLILLDLRLYDEKDRSVDVNYFSGAKLLQKIRNNHKGIPVLILTASNKVWSYEELMRLGADAYWIKEGIDNYFTAEESVKNYFKLLHLIERLTDERYKKLNDIARLIDHVSSEGNQWWDISKGNKWVNCELINGNSDEIIKLLQATLELTKEYLHSFYLEYGYKNGTHESFYLASIINKLGTIVEIIHNITKYDFIRHLKIRELYEKREGGYNIANQITNDRNTSSHRNYVKIQWADFLEFYENVSSYLKTLPSPSTIPCEHIVDTKVVKQAYSRNQNKPYPPDDFEISNFMNSILEGTIVKFLPDKDDPNINFAAIVEFYLGINGFLHMNQTKVLNNNKPVNNISEVLNINDKVEVLVTNVDTRGRIMVSAVRLLSNAT